MINKQNLEMAKKKADKSNDTELYFELLNAAYRLLNSPEPEIKELWEETSLAIDALKKLV